MLVRMGNRTSVSPDGCWEWDGATTKGGYGQIGLYGEGGRKLTLYTHRVSYETFCGPIPEGLQIDHLCRNRRCWNPAHLEAVTGRENRARGIGPALLRARYAAQTHCIRNHEFTHANTRVTKSGKRQCKACDRLRFQPGWGRILKDHRPR